MGSVFTKQDEQSRPPVEKNEELGPLLIEETETTEDPVQPKRVLDQEEIVTDLRDEGMEATVSHGGLAYVFQFGDGHTKKRPPVRLSRVPVQPSCTNENCQGYSLDDRQMMADILRLEKVADRKMQARLAKEKADEVKTRRDSHVPELETLVTSEVVAMATQSDIEHRTRMLKELALKTKQAKTMANKAKEI